MLFTGTPSVPALSRFTATLYWGTVVRKLVESAVISGRRVPWAMRPCAVRSSAFTSPTPVRSSRMYWNPLTTPRPGIGGSGKANAIASGYCDTTALARIRIGKSCVCGERRWSQGFSVMNIANVLELIAWVRTS
jgi:hypothetical protein